jgi:two-component system response regulator YesN
MYQILIVDDEILVRTNIKMMIDWDGSDFCLCGEAANGVDALSILREKHPEIVFTDMKMPVMDGLALSDEIAKSFSDIALIALSNYDDFEYVRGVLKNGAVDYILKHNVSPKIIMEALYKAKKFCDKSRHSVQKSCSESENSITALKENFIIKLLSGFYNDRKVILNHMQVLEVGFAPENIVPVLMRASGNSATDQRLRNRNLFEYGILNITKEILTDMGNGEICSVSNGMFCLLLSFEGIRSENKITDRINSTLRRIQKSLAQYLNIKANFCVGKISADIIEVPEAYEEIEGYINSGYIFSKSSIVRPHCHNPVTRNLTGLNIKHERELTAAIKGHDLPTVKSIIQDIFKGIKDQNLDMESSQIIFTDLFGVINTVCKQYHIEQTSIFSGGNSIPNILSSYDFDKIMLRFELLFEQVISHMPSAKESHYSHYIKAAVDLIHQDYKKNISQQNIADKLGISGSYLSSLFKSETGTGFSEYVADFRLKKAENLFKNGENNIREVAMMCGFYDYYYFFKVFKKKYSMTPNEFIKNYAAG